MWGLQALEMSIRLIRFASAVIVGLAMGIVASSFLAMIASSRGFDGDVVFNVAGSLITVVSCILLSTHRS